MQSDLRKKQPEEEVLRNVALWGIMPTRESHPAPAAMAAVSLLTSLKMKSTFILFLLNARPLFWPGRTSMTLQRNCSLAQGPGAPEASSAIVRQRGDLESQRCELEQRGSSR